MSIAIEKKIVDRPEPIILHVPIDEEVVLADDVKVPAGIVDLASFRNWAHSDEFPERGRIEFSNGTIYVDLSMEQLYVHNRVKIAFIVTLDPLCEALEVGHVFNDGARVSMPVVDASREPVVLFVSFDSLDAGRVREVPGRVRGETELEGSPDMALEVVSDFSEEKDFIELPHQYFQAGVREYWRVDARKDVCAFEIFRAGSDGFVPVEQKDGWQWSTVFGHWFRLMQTVDKRGKPRFKLLAKKDI